jgi:hypothetical protein
MIYHVGTLLTLDNEFADESLRWTCFGGVTPRLDARSSAIFSVAEMYRPSPRIVKAATDRSQPYVCRSRFDGDKQFQTTFMNKTYAVFSTAVLPGDRSSAATSPSPTAGRRGSMMCRTGGSPKPSNPNGFRASALLGPDTDAATTGSLVP